MSDPDERDDRGTGQGPDEPAPADVPPDELAGVLEAAEETLTRKPEIDYLLVADRASDLDQGRRTDADVAGHRLGRPDDEHGRPLRNVAGSPTGDVGRHHHAALARRDRPQIHQQVVAARGKPLDQEPPLPVRRYRLGSRVGVGATWEERRHPRAVDRLPAVPIEDATTNRSAALEREVGTLRPVFSIPVRNQAVEYAEYYTITEAEFGLFMADPDAATLSEIGNGRAVFERVGCAACHVPELRLQNTVFEEPTLRGNGNYYNQRLAERDEGYDPARPVRFDLLTEAQPPRVEAHPDGGAIIRLYGDLKRHHMGRVLADPTGPEFPFTANFEPVMMDGKPVVIPPTAFLTPELWGVGNTGPWLHDGRAGSLEEAILLHGEEDPAAVGDPLRSEAQESRDAFAALSPEDRSALVTFLLSLRTFSPGDDAGARE